MSTSIVVFASGTGSGFESIARAVKEKRLDAEIQALVCDRPGALVIEKARHLGIKTIVIPGKADRLTHEKEILNELVDLDPRFLVLSGYMRILTPHLIDAFRSDRGYYRIVNIHPSLLPSFSGMHGYSQAFLHGAKVAGATVHLVDKGLDSGPICAQESFAIDQCKDAAEVETLGKAIESKLYPKTLSWVLPEHFDLVNRNGRLCVCPI